MNSACPSPEQLRAFAIGDLSTTQLEWLAGHVDSCAECSRHLQEADQHQDELVRSLTQLGDEPQRSSDPPEAWIQRASRLEWSTADEGAQSMALDPGSQLARKLASGNCRLGRFELQAELGVGAFGHVFRARDTELDRVVALKLQRAGSFASDEEIERFLREARSVAQLKHPGIVAIYDSVRTEDEICYLVTEYVDGQSLESVLADQGCTVTQAIQWTADIAQALHYAHQHGVVHRDVKPSNILIDGRGQPHLMDFGLAKREFGETMTSEGRVMGTPAYMSPEQAQGQSHRVDARSDIFSLGVMLYELLCGERPFQGKGRMLLLQILEDEPKSLRQLNSSLPRDLETICLKALAKSPAERYATAADLADDLRRHVQGEPIKARRRGVALRLWQWGRRYPVAASLLIAVPLGSMVGFTYLTRLSTYFVEQTALESARMEADMLEKINEYYSEEVVGRLDWKQIEVTHQYATKPHSLPLPFTFMIDAGQRITADDSGMEVRIYSEYPWRQVGGPQDRFERAAIESLQAVSPPASEPGSYHEFTHENGQPVLRYARAQIMKESCVKCHNEHPESPKRDWHTGELAGILSLTRPLEGNIRTTRSGLQSAFHLMGLVATSMSGLCLLLMWTAHRRMVRSNLPSGHR